MGKQKTEYVDKWGAKPKDGPPPGGYDIEAAEKMTKPTAPAVVIKEDLNLYKAPESIRPEPTTEHLKPFGSDVKLHISLGDPAVERRMTSPQRKKKVKPINDAVNLEIDAI
jgi:hypothetical protein